MAAGTVAGIIAKRQSIRQNKTALGNRGRFLLVDGEHNPALIGSAGVQPQWQKLVASAILRERWSA
jgi:hypothetical protein